MSTTYAFNDDDCKVRTRVSQSARFGEGVVKMHGRSVTAVVTDYEPSMVKAGRVLNERQLTMQVGGAGRRLLSSIAVVFAGGGVTVVLSNMRNTIGPMS